MTRNTSAVAAPRASASSRSVVVSFSFRCASSRSALHYKLTLQIGYELLGIGERAVGRRVHLRTSSGPTFRGIIP